MNKFLEMKERGELILFSELLEDIPPKDTLYELLPNPQNPRKQLVDRRDLEVLKLRLDGFHQTEIAERLGLTQSQVAYTSKMTRNSLRGGVPPYIEVDIPRLRELLELPPKRDTGYRLLSQLLQDMPSDEDLLNLYIERGNSVRVKGKTPPTNQDLHLLRMRIREQNYDSIGGEIGMTGEEVRRQIAVTLKKIRRELKIKVDIPELYWPENPSAQAGNAQDQAPQSEAEKRLNALTKRQREVWLLQEQGLKKKEIAQELSITYSAVREHIRYAELRLHEYDQYYAAEKRNDEPVSLPLTRGEVKTILAALEVYENEIECEAAHRSGGDWIGRLPFKANITADLYDKAQKALFGKTFYRMPKNWDEDDTAGGDK